MASRSFKPASYLASAAQQPTRSVRPSFARSSSASSVLSSKSDNSFSVHLHSLATTEHTKDTERVVEAPENANEPVAKTLTCTSHLRHEVDLIEPEVETSRTERGRKGSQPIAIELPRSRQPAVYTPLSARGELLGGYFPFNDDVSNKAAYANHNKNKNHAAFSHRRYNYSHSRASSTASSPSGMSNTSSALPSPGDTTTKLPAMLSSTFLVPDPICLTMPVGKYYPSNYNSPVTTPSGPSAATSTTNLAIPPSAKRHSVHDRRGADVKEKLHEYQREMIAQARRASKATMGTTVGCGEPVSPKLEPLGSPGPITPFALEEEVGWLGIERTEGGREQRKRKSSRTARGFVMDDGTKDEEDAEMQDEMEGKREARSRKI